MAVDKSLTPLYTQQQVEEIAKQAAQQALLSAHLDNGISEAEVPTMEGDENMGRQRVHVTLPSGELVWITGNTFNDLIRNALEKYGGNNISAPVLSTDTFKEYTEKIFDMFLRPRWKPSTANTNKFLLDKHIMPYFENMTLASIDTAAVQQFFQTKQHLSKSYTKQMLIMLHEIFENAVEDKKMSGDPTSSKRITLPEKVTKREALDPEQFYDIVAHLHDLDGPEALFMALLCFTGMRRGEILGLKWDNILDDKILVRAQVTFKGNTSTYSEYTKSKSGIRDLPITEELAPYLTTRGDGLVFGGDTPYTQSKFDRMWQRIGKKINLYGASPHVFRHTYLSILAASNVDPKTIQAIAGHADFSFTFNKYIDRNKFNMQDAGTQFSNHLKKLTQKLTHTETQKANNINGLKVVNEDNN